MFLAVFMFQINQEYTFVCPEHENKVTLTTQGSSYLFEVLSGKFIISQPYVG